MKTMMGEVEMKWKGKNTMMTLWRKIDTILLQMESSSQRMEILEQARPSRSQGIHCTSNV